MADEAYDTIETIDDTFVFGKELGDAVEGVSSTDEPNSSWVFVGFDVVLPDVFCEFLCFFSGNIGSLRLVLNALTDMN